MAHASERAVTNSSLPAHDPSDQTENAVIARLAGNWHRRAAVKRPEPDLDELFEMGRPDYPEALLPFRDHPTYQDVDDATRARLLAWGWIAFNKNIMDIEQRVVNPGFTLLADDAFGTGLDETTALSVTQAMVDEQYHTLMHLNACSVTRRHRGDAMPSSFLPLAHKPRRLERALEGSSQRWERDLWTLAFTTVAEISINAQLDLVAEDDTIQPINQATAKIHSRDEYCHSSITHEIAKNTYQHLDADRRQFFLTALGEGMEAFSANDFTTWARVVELAGVPGGSEMVRDVSNDPNRKRLLQDFSGLHRLCAEMEVLDGVPFDWSTVRIG
jgi:hypothetical protein